MEMIEQLKIDEEEANLINGESLDDLDEMLSEIED